MKTIKLNLPDAIADRIEAKGKALGFESVGAYIEFDLTKTEVHEKECELEDEYEKEVIELDRQFVESRRSKHIANLTEDIGVFCKVLKENFPDMKVNTVVSENKENPGADDQE